MQSIDEKQIIERLRSNLRARLRGEPLPEPPRPESNFSESREALDLDLAVLRDGFDVFHVPLGSHRPVVGPAISVTKRLLRQMLTPVLERQVSYNAANQRVAQALAEQVVQLTRECAELRKMVIDRAADDHGDGVLEEGEG